MSLEKDITEIKKLSEKKLQEDLENDANFRPDPSHKPMPYKRRAKAEKYFENDKCTVVGPVERYEDLVSLGNGAQWFSNYPDAQRKQKFDACVATYGWNFYVIISKTGLDRICVVVYPDKTPDAYDKNDIRMSEDDLIAKHVELLIPDFIYQKPSDIVADQEVSDLEKSWNTSNTDVPNESKTNESTQRQVLKNFSGKIIGFIDIKSNGDQELKNYSGKILGTFVKGGNVTRDFSGKILFQGNALTALIAQQ